MIANILILNFKNNCSFVYI